MDKLMPEIALGLSVPEIEALVCFFQDNEDKVRDYIWVEDHNLGTAIEKLKEVLR